ncbi:hypothetical protein DFH09DRAFT_1262088 [Mycena vulgaris]|nr:hypothetical protein DFH09DRAFT_1262088 [Mycena vulgaris]
MPEDPDISQIKWPKGSSKPGHKCTNCYAPATEVSLKHCARCKAVKYCSRECQKGHWKTHKEQCNQNTEHSESLAQADIVDALGSIIGRAPMNPYSISLTELDQRLEKWIKYHNSTLMAATIHALALPRDLTRSRTHVVRLVVQPREDIDLPASKFFRVVEAEAVKIADAEQRGGAWPESLRQTAIIRAESEGKRRGTVAAMGIECPPLGVQFVPFGSLRDLSVLRILPNWKEIMTRDVESGKKFTKFG